MVCSKCSLFRNKADLKIEGWLTKFNIIFNAAWVFACTIISYGIKIFVIIYDMIWSPLIRWEAIHRSQFFLFCKQSWCLAFFFFLHMWHVYISKHFFKSLFVSFVSGFFLLMHSNFPVLFENKARALSNFNRIENKLSA